MQDGAEKTGKGQTEQTDGAEQKVCYNTTFSLGI